MPGVLGKYGTSALKYWGSILASAYAGASTADMWVAIRGAQQAYGLDRPGTSAPDVSVLRGYANRIANGAAAFNAANPSDAITSAMMATGPYTLQTAEGIATTPMYSVRAIVTTQAPDGSGDGNWMTFNFAAANMPGTVGELVDTISATASDLAAAASGKTGTPTGELTGVFNIEITVL